MAKKAATITARRPVIRGGKRVGYVIAYSDGTFRGAVSKGTGRLTKSKAFRREAQARSWLLSKVPSRGKAGRPQAAKRRRNAPSKTGRRLVKRDKTEGWGVYRLAGQAEGSRYGVMYMGEWIGFLPTLQEAVDYAKYRVGPKRNPPRGKVVREERKKNPKGLSFQKAGTGYDVYMGASLEGHVVKRKDGWYAKGTGPGAYLRGPFTTRTEAAQHAVGKTSEWRGKKRNPPGNASQPYKAPWAKVRKLKTGYSVYGVDRSGTKVNVRAKAKATAQGIAESIRGGTLATGGAKSLGRVTGVRRRRNPNGATKTMAGLEFEVLDMRGVRGFPQSAEGFVYVHKRTRKVAGRKVVDQFVIRTGRLGEGWRVDRHEPPFPAEAVPGAEGHYATPASAAKRLAAYLKMHPKPKRNPAKKVKGKRARKANQSATQINAAVAYARKVWNLEIGRAKREGRMPDQGRIYSLVEKRYPSFDVKLLRSIAFDTRPARKANKSKRKRNYHVPPMTQSRIDRSYGDDPTQAAVGDRVVIDPTGKGKLYLTVVKASRSGALELVNAKGTKYTLTILPSGGAVLRTPRGKRLDVSPYGFHFSTKSNPKSTVGQAHTYRPAGVDEAIGILRSTRTSNIALGLFFKRMRLLGYSADAAHKALSYMVERGIATQRIPKKIGLVERQRNAARSKGAPTRKGKGKGKGRLTKAAMAPVTSAFTKIQAKARAVEPELNFLKLVARPGLHDSPRHFAETDGKIVYVAPELAKESAAVINGVLMHEFGHAWRYLTAKTKLKTYDGEERAADKAAERIFGKKIYYDKRGVETTSRGKRPRPAGLR